MQRNRFETKLERVSYMEALYERIRERLNKENPVSEDLAQELRAQIKELQDYYEGAEWLEDFDAEQRGEFPRNMKRGILAEDTLYDLICEMEDRLMKHD
ncbi:MAG: DUF4298 domain-containing protein [Eubacteriales bacterium]|nr:DUF4298 domain-containing protein [Eubacteriales bacterium]